MLFRNIYHKLPALFLASLPLVCAAPAPVHGLEPRCQDYDPSLPLHAESLPPDGDRVVPLSVPFLEPKGHQGGLVKSIKGELAREFAPTSRALQKATYNDYWDGVPLDPELSASGSAHDSSWFDNTGGGAAVGRACIDPSGKRARSGAVNIRLPGREPDSARNHPRVKKPASRVHTILNGEMGWDHDVLTPLPVGFKTQKRSSVRDLTHNCPNLRGRPPSTLNSRRLFIGCAMPLPTDWNRREGC